ncbi:MAG: kinase-like domain-containing protein [Benjaminiella poitrasii]|nr:MAG: kinase-like domain-containing protein [Benjaminiella poitrasii]
MCGSFATIEKKQFNNNKCLIYKTYHKTHGNLVLQHFKRELWALQQLDIKTEQESRRHHIIYFMGYQETEYAHQLIFPMYKLDLQSLLSINKGDHQLANNFLLQISKGLNYIHSKSLVHCDLKPSNVLIDDTLGSIHMSICDFGCTRMNHCIDEITTTDGIGTRYYKAPEHFFGSRKYSASTDIWSLGVIFLQLLVGYPIFSGETDIEQIGRIVFRLGSPSKEIQNKEMSDYPDTNKLSFFSCEESEPEFDSDEEEEKTIEFRRPLQKVMDEDHIAPEVQMIINNTITWSVEKRWTISQIISYSELLPFGK